uniref:Actin-related protein 2/3 complex subunit 3 n=1 Tax=Timema cristinae TaxID=61476 RepID=A0A7R9CEA2_TIMCR|nr:unnamed protein product [Timema cristinae]
MNSKGFPASYDPPPWKQEILFVVDGPSESRWIKAAALQPSDTIRVTEFPVRNGDKIVKLAYKGLEELYSLAISKFDIPGEAGFPLNSVYAKPSNPAEADLMRQYLSQIRQATGARLCDKVYATEDGRPSKWWLCFARKKFMDKSLSGPGY